MNKKMVKIVTILALVFVVVATIAMPTFATSSKYEDFSAMNPDNIGGETDTSGASASVGRIAGVILNIVRIVAVAVAVIMLIVLAIKYISAAPNDKAEIKKHAVVYIVGAVILFSASGILGIIQRFALNVRPE